MRRGNFTDGGFKAQGWNRIRDDFNRETGLTLDKQKLQNQMSDMKKKYTIFQQTVDNSGFGWDEALQIPTASDQVWESWIEKHPLAAPYRYRTLSFYQGEGEPTSRSAPHF